MNNGISCYTALTLKELNENGSWTNGSIEHDKKAHAWPWKLYLT